MHNDLRMPCIPIPLDHWEESSLELNKQFGMRHISFQEMRPEGPEVEVVADTIKCSQAES